MNHQPPLVISNGDERPRLVLTDGTVIPLLVAAIKVDGMVEYRTLDGKPHQVSIDQVLSCPFDKDWS